jgi:uncharacterized protein YggE
MKILAFFLLVLTPFVISAQQTGSSSETPYIEVVGTAERSIVPDEIYVSINLHERYEGKNKVGIEKQEKNLKNELADAGIPLDQLSLSDAQGAYVKVKWGKKDVLNQKEFILMLKTAQEVGVVFGLLDELNIEDAGIYRVDHSNIENLKKEVKIEAIKAAKDKVIYLLEAIGQKPGKALVIYENSPVYASNISANVEEIYQNSLSSSKTKTEYDIQFEKIIIRSSIYMKYSIE